MPTLPKKTVLLSCVAGLTFAVTARPPADSTTQGALLSLSFAQAGAAPAGTAGKTSTVKTCPLPTRRNF